MRSGRIARNNFYIRATLTAYRRCHFPCILGAAGGRYLDLAIEREKETDTIRKLKNISNFRFR